jgi:alpha-beta hydrolase superfamily lysophospholipase
MPVPRHGRASTSSTGSGPGEVAASALVVTDALDRLTRTVHDMHRAIARRGLARLLPAPVRAVQEAATATVYGLVRTGIAITGRAGALALDTAGPTRAATPFTTTPRGRHLAGVLDGAFGDHLADRHPALARPVRIRLTGADVEPDPTALARHYPAAGASVVVFLHGVIETEEWWTDPAAPGDDFASRLTRDLGCTGVQIRYPSGRRVSQNGADLAELLEELVTAWPRPVRRIALVGHSMGGLVARSALHQGTARGHTWPDRTRHLICLGTPLTGAPLERAANTLTWLLRRFDTSAPIAELLAARSAGIKDLRYGSIHEQDWRDTDPDALRRTAQPPPYRPPAAVRHSNLAATLARDPGPLGLWIGDLLVPTTSALAPVPPARTHRLGGLGHRDLLTHDAAYDRLLGWLRDQDAPDASPGGRPGSPGDRRW